MVQAIGINDSGGRTAHAGDADIEVEAVLVMGGSLQQKLSHLLTNATKPRDRNVDAAHMFPSAAEAVISAGNSPKPSRG
ncbi:MAG: hypothetical protein ABI268_02400 [Rhodanobacter sp.]